jgi:hypothetical protein
LIELPCSRCQTLKPEEDFHVDRTRHSGRRYMCRPCISAWRSEQRLANPLKFQQWENAASVRKRAARRQNPKERWVTNVYFNAKARAKHSMRPFTLTKDDIRALAAITTHCPLLECTLRYDNSRALTPNAATLDRKDSQKGYTPDNCWIISFKANRSKNNLTLRQIERLAKNLREQLGLQEPSGTEFDPE